VVSSQSQVEEAKSIIAKAVEYTLAMSVELARREMASASDADQTLKRQLELNAYFTVPKLEVAHRQLALTAAMKQAFSKKQYSSSLSFANRIVANGAPAKLVENVSYLQPINPRIQSLTEIPGQQSENTK
jgi:coatomer subunit alpha